MGGRRMIRPTDLVGVAEIATRAGVKAQTVGVWRRRHPTFPEPLVSLACGDVWEWPVVAAWLAQPRPPGRPRSRR